MDFDAASKYRSYCESTVINSATYDEPLLLGVLHVITSCLHWERCCPLPVILCTEYRKQCPFSTPSVSSFSLPLQLPYLFIDKTRG